MGRTMKQPDSIRCLVAIGHHVHIDITREAQQLLDD
jgi:hypothetical protein